MTDLVMPHMTGLEVLERITEFDPAIDVILMTAHYTTETAVEAIRKGAADISTSQFLWLRCANVWAGLLMPHCYGSR